jgi:hypothetical protein
MRPSQFRVSKDLLAKRLCPRVSHAGGELSLIPTGRLASPLPRGLRKIAAAFGSTAKSPLGPARGRPDRERARAKARSPRQPSLLRSRLHPRLREIEGLKSNITASPWTRRRVNRWSTAAQIIRFARGMALWRRCRIAPQERSVSCATSKRSRASIRPAPDARRRQSDRRRRLPFAQGPLTTEDARRRPRLPRGYVFKARAVTALAGVVGVGLNGVSPLRDRQNNDSKRAVMKRPVRFRARRIAEAQDVITWRRSAVAGVLVAGGAVMYVLGDCGERFPGAGSTCVGAAPLPSSGASAESFREL